MAAKILNFLKIFLLSPYIKAIIAFFIFFVGAKLIYFFLTHLVAKWTKKTITQLDDIILFKVKSPIFYIIVLAGIATAINFLPIPTLFKEITSKAVISIVLAISCYLIAIFFNLIIKAWINRKKAIVGKARNESLVIISRKILNLIIFILLITFILSLWGVKVTGLVASLGIAGLIIGLALQNTLANIFGGIALIVDGSFKIGDFIELENGESGKIIDVGLRSTRIESFDKGNEIIVPNSKLVMSEITNYGRPLIRLKMIVNIGVAYGSDIKKVKQILLNCAKKTDRVLKNPSPQVYFIEMADFSLNFKVIFWIDTYRKRLEIQDKIISSVYEELQSQGIQIPFPTRTIYIEKSQ
ncbi:mechanosensitive ion channel family protein [Candidatus Aerophobetes bacterium]|nr:mechanosensitive ion channel family protein [Candidatus Aerophobetes bacterium]